MPVGKRRGDFGGSSSTFASTFKLPDRKDAKFYSLKKLEGYGFDLSRLPFSIRVVLESLLRHYDGARVTEEDIIALASWGEKKFENKDIPFVVSRILMQDFTGVPAVVDLAAMREYMAGANEPPERIQPLVPVDLIIDHSVQVDQFNAVNALALNQRMEMKRNGERYRLLKWAHESLSNFRVLPPSAGICHQVNLEYIATCVTVARTDSGYVAFPDTLVGTDSHTTMIGGLGVVGFGVGGIEAEAAMLGEPVSFQMPKVLGVKLTGRLKEGVTATDFALTLTKRLREKGVVNMFVEFWGSGVATLSLPDRATLSNMCPEYGATIAFFPVDRETLRYMKDTGRELAQIEVVESYYRAQGMFEIDYSKVAYSDALSVDLGTVTPSVSGPSQPKQEVPLERIGDSFTSAFSESKAEDHGKLSKADYTRWAGESLAAENGQVKSAKKRSGIKSAAIKYGDGTEVVLSDGDVVISSITSCTNTSNPSVMIAAGLLAKKALEKGLSVNTRKVKTSLGPGSRVVAKYLERAELMQPLTKLGFGLVGFGCITCIGNSGPLIEKQSEAINANGLAVASVLSGNRNYEARIHKDVRANYLMSPPLVVAFAIAGTVLKDLTREHLARNKNGEEIYLKDIWPSQEEIREVMSKVLKRKDFAEEYGAGLYEVNPYWNRLEAPSGTMFGWDSKSTYINLPPFFEDLNRGSKRRLESIEDAAVLAVFGDSISTDHISPAGEIGVESPAGRYLLANGVKQADFNTYGARRGNHEVMMRGTFANNRIKNLMLPGVEGGFTLHFPSGRRMAIYDAAMEYMKEGRKSVVFAGVEYGSGSSRDWAAKGPMLLGVKAVIAGGFERIHRSNLIGMGVLPLQFKNGDTFASLKIDPARPVSIRINDGMAPGDDVRLGYTALGGKKGSVLVKSRIDTRIELGYYRDGGILNHVMLGMLNKNGGSE